MGYGLFIVRAVGCTCKAVGNTSGYTFALQDAPLPYTRNFFLQKVSLFPEALTGDSGTHTLHIICKQPGGVMGLWDTHLASLSRSEKS